MVCVGSCNSAVGVSVADLVAYAEVGTLADRLKPRPVSMGVRALYSFDCCPGSGGADGVCLSSGARMGVSSDTVVFLP